jgi:carboxypeptidase PM20D1
VKMALWAGNVILKKLEIGAASALLSGMLAGLLATTADAATMAAKAPPASMAAMPHLTNDKITAKAVEILGKSVAFQTVVGKGQVPAYAAYLAGVLKAGGFAASDIEIRPMGETAVLIARYKGDGSKKPMLVLAHMDVVAADPKDWTRDPFKMVSENGYLFGRGVYDNKFNLSMAVETLVRLKAEGFKPKRDIILVLSGDEETNQDTARALAKQFPTAEFALNGDSGGGTLADNGQPIAYNLQAAEKTYADYEITFTNPGGHSSRPGKTNAIYDLAKAIDHISAYQFPAQSSELTREFFKVVGGHTPGDLGQAMLHFAANPEDKDAIARISTEPEYVGQIHTTCVATMLRGGHALNALPQSATVSVNCRIFPGVTVESVKQTLLKEVNMPGAKITVLGNPVVSDASPLRKDVLAAVRKAVDRRYPGIPIVPQMSVGASDSMFFRNAGIPCYGVEGDFMKPSDDFSHGLNERMPIATIDGALDHWHVILTELSK